MISIICRLIVYTLVLAAPNSLVANAKSRVVRRLSTSINAINDNSQSTEEISSSSSDLLGDSLPTLEFLDQELTLYTLVESPIYEEPTEGAAVINQLPYSRNVQCTGVSNDGNWVRLIIDGTVCFAKSDCLNLVTQERIDDIELLARIIWAESGDQPLEGQRAVGSVVYNRWKYGYGETAHDSIYAVITTPRQFYGYKSKQWYVNYSPQTYEIATEVYDGHTNLPANVMNFKSTRSKAKWRLKVYSTIGDHTFYYSR